MSARIIVSPRFELFLALAECLGPARDGAPWLSQARRKLDPAARRRMGDLALAPTFWRALAAVPGSAALDADTDAVIAAFADVPADAFAERCRSALPSAQPDPAIARLVDELGRHPAGLQHAAVDALRRFDRLAFAALWRRMASDLEAAAANAVAPVDAKDTLIFPSLFGEYRFQLGKRIALTLPIDRLRAPTPQSAPPPRTSLDPEIVFRALGDATRYAIARLIAREPLSGAELARRLGVSGPTLTHHLKALRRARLVLEERRGNRILLSLDRRTIESLSITALESLFGGAPVTIRRSRRDSA
jgi:DNA-binding transcriptional ArsR family regulator